MAFQLFWDLTGIGFTLFLTLFGALVLMLTGRFAPVEAARIGLGRHVEALLLVAAAVTFALGGMGNVPIYAGGGGVVAVSLLGAIVPSILAIYFLVAAGPLRLILSIPWIAFASIVAFMISTPVEGVGIIATAPGFYLPALAAALGGIVTGGRSLRSIPLAYAYGVLGGLIGADLLRMEWILSTPFTAASLGGAEAFDLVFLLGLWAAAIAAVPLLPRLLRMRKGEDAWFEAARCMHAGDLRSALDGGVAHVEGILAQWAVSQGLADAPRAVLLERSTARPVMAQVDVLRRTPEPWNPEAVRRVLENLEGLGGRLVTRPVRDAAPRADRFAAGAIDAVPVIIIGFLAGLLAIGFQLDPGAGEPARQLAIRTFLAQGIFVVWSMFAAHVLLLFAMEWLMRGESLGKRVMGLRVRHIGGGRPGAWDLFVRNVARLLDVLMLYLIPFFARKHAGRQRLGDYFAQTYVQRGPRSRRPPSRLPPPARAGLPAPVPSAVIAPRHS